MKIQVKADGRNVTIPVPTGMIFAKPSVWAGVKLAKIMLKSKYSGIPDHVKEQVKVFFEKLPEESIYAACAEIMRIKHKFGRWTLLEMESESGEYVQITL